MTVDFFLVIQDAKGMTSRVEIPFPNNVSLSALQTNIPSIAGLVQDLVTGGLVGAGFTVNIDLSAASGDFSGWGPVASLASDVQEKAEFVARTVNGFLKRINLPTIDEGIFIPQSPEVDMTDPAVAAFVTFLEDGIGGAGGVFPVDSRGEDLVTVVEASENWGKRRR